MEIRLTYHARRKTTFTGHLDCVIGKNKKVPEKYWLRKQETYVCGSAVPTALSMAHALHPPRPSPINRLVIERSPGRYVICPVGLIHSRITVDIISGMDDALLFIGVCPELDAAIEQGFRRHL